MKPNRMNRLNWSRSAGMALTATLVTVCYPTLSSPTEDGNFHG
ncbi:MAG: hypothetical protein ABIS50_00945 [Luteolibacter sp.]